MLVRPQHEVELTVGATRAAREWDQSGASGPEAPAGPTCCSARGGAELTYIMTVLPGRSYKSRGADICGQVASQIQQPRSVVRTFITM